MRFKKAVSRFRTQLEADGKSRHTRGAYLRDVRAFGSWLDREVDIGSIRPEAIAGFFASDAMCQKAPISLNRMKTSIRVFFRFLQETGAVKNDPARLIKSARCMRKIPSVLSGDEKDALLAAVRTGKGPLARRDYVMVSLLVGTGMRLGSLAGLSVFGIDFDQGLIKIQAKGNREEVVFLNPQLKRLLKTYMRECALSSDSPLFQNHRGGRLGVRQIQCRISRWLKVAGIDHQASVHTLRHTFATRLYEKTGDLHLVQRALGHKQITTTEIYARVSDRSLQEAMKFV